MGGEPAPTQSAVGSFIAQADRGGTAQVTVFGADEAYDVAGIENPYQGLDSYTAATRALYAGREEQVREALNWLTAVGPQQTLLFVTGASGSGKSSFVQAGLVPALEAYHAAAGWQVHPPVIRRPGPQPVISLGRALEALGSPTRPSSEWAATLREPDDLTDILESLSADGRLRIMVFDQFEEVFSQSQSDEATRTACALLAGLEGFDRLRTHVLVTLRADFLPAVFADEVLYARARHGIELRAMKPAELKRAIEHPVEVRNAQLSLAVPRRVEPELVDRLVADVGADPTLLPLLQVTLTSLWEQAPHRLVMSRYHTLTDSLRQKADAVIERDPRGRPRSEIDQAAVMGIFLDLVNVSLDDDARRDVRQTRAKSALLLSHPERAPLLDELVDARLLSTWTDMRTDEPLERVDIIHETLLVNWPTLAEAISERRESLQRRARFKLALQDWLDHAQAEDYLLVGVRLAEARHLASELDVEARNVDAQEFIDRSNAREEMERQRQIEQLQALASAEHRRAEDQVRATRRVRRLAGVLAGALLGVLVTAVVALTQRNEAISQQNIAVAQQKIALSRELALRAVSQLSTDPVGSVLLAIQAAETSPTEQASAALRQALLAAPHVQFEMGGPTDPIGEAVFSTDGGQVLTIGKDGTARLRNASSGTELSD